MLEYNILNQKFIFLLLESDSINNNFLLLFHYHRVKLLLAAVQMAKYLVPNFAGVRQIYVEANGTWCMKITTTNAVTMIIQKMKYLITDMHFLEILSAFILKTLIFLS